MKQSIVPVAVLLLFAGAVTGGLLSGCGSSSTDNGNSNQQRTRVTATIAWPARTRVANAPSSALSGQVILVGANPNGSDFVWTFNRDPNNSEAHTTNLTSPNEAIIGTYNLRFAFFSQPNGTGDTVGNATKTVNLAQSTDLGDVTVTNTIAKIEVAGNQKVGVGENLRPAFTAFTATNTPVNVSPESGIFQVVGGQNHASIINGLVRGVNPGIASITATVDGVTSPATEIGIGQAAIVFTTSGAKSYIPVEVQQPGQSFFYANVAEFAPFNLSADWFVTAQVTAPLNYGDRQFSKWQFNGADIGNTNVLSFNVRQRGAGTLRAVYVSRQPGVDGYAPNFYKFTFKQWNRLVNGQPVRIFFDSASGMTTNLKNQIIQQGINFWVAASGDRIRYTEVNTANEADITFRFGDVPSGANGICESRWDGNNFLTDADIILRNDFRQATTPEAIGAFTLAARHEFGHALGMTGEDPLGGHSTDPNDTMFATGNPTVGVITARDINTLATMYADALSRGRSVATTGAPVGFHRHVCK